MSFSEIVDVSISRDTRAVQRAAFGTAMFLGRHCYFADRTQIFTDLETLVASGIDTGSAEYRAAAAYFGSDVTPTELVLGRQEVDKVVLSFTVENSANYSLYVGADNLTPALFTITSDGTATAAEIAGLLDTALAGIAASVIGTVNGNTLELTPATGRTMIVHSWSDNISVAYESSEALVDAIVACQQDNDTWYALATFSHHREPSALEALYPQSINAVAAYIETQKKIYGYSTADSNAIIDSDDHIAGDLLAAGYARTFGIYDGEAGTTNEVPTAATTYGEMGWLGRMLPTDPGAATWMFKKVAGLSVDNLTANESTEARNRNLNTYEQFHGQNMVREGKMADGTYIDIIHGADWLEARMTERLFFLLLNNDKIPYTDAGVSAIEAEVRAQLLEGVAAGYITDDFTITVPKVRDISPNTRANRVLPAVKFVATLQGAVHSVTVQGRVQA